MTAQLEYFCDLLTVLLEYIELYYALCPSAAEEVVDMRGAGLTQTYFYSLVR